MDKHKLVTDISDQSILFAYLEHYYLRTITLFSVNYSICYFVYDLILFKKFKYNFLFTTYLLENRLFLFIFRNDVPLLANRRDESRVASGTSHEIVVCGCSEELDRLL